ncbi:glycosyltransferase family 1 protein [Mycolicibacterium moriokaense]|nr:glycosyltransferase family 1 protein [Mycolicibacterium moriokaense]
MKLGMLVYATDTGLGRQTELLYRMLKPARTMLVDISSLNGMPVHEDWYEFDVRTRGIPTTSDIERFLYGIDTLFLCETPLNYRLISRAKERGIRIIMQINPELLDYFVRPNLPRPDVIALPTVWKQDEIQSLLPDTDVIYLPVPVDSHKLRQRHVTKVETYFHIAGRPAANDRNGTRDFIAAARMAQPHEPKIRFLLYCQKPDAEIRRLINGTRIELIEHVDDYSDLYAQGDILVLPRRYGGLCLPAQEAVAAGIPVLMPSISPNDSWMPSEWLTDVTRNPRSFKPRGTVEIWDTNVQPLAQKMLDLYRDQQAVENMGKQARDLASSLSWQKLEPVYRDVLEIFND